MTTNRFAASFARALVCAGLVLTLISTVFAAGLLRLGRQQNGVVPPASGPQIQPGPFIGPKIWLQDSQQLPVVHVGPGAPGMAASLTKPLSMASAGFHEDGPMDLVVGYGTLGGGVVVLHHGNLDAFAPQSDASFRAVGRGDFPAPFLPDAQTFPVPVTPDFMGAGDILGSGHADLVVAARGGNALYILPGNGKGKFGAPRIINLPGTVTCLAAGNLGNVGQSTNLLISVTDPKNAFFLVVFGDVKHASTPLAVLPLSAPASNVLFGDFGDTGQDAAFLSGGKVQILRSSTMQLVPVSLPVSANAMALGSFLYDRNGGSQIALLDSDGSVQIAVRNEFDPRVYSVEEFNAIRKAKLNHQPAPLVPARSFPVSGWRVVDNFPSVAKVAPGQVPVFFRTRVSDHATDDIMWLGASSGRMVVISHPDLEPGAATFLPGQVSVKPYNGSPVAALPMRINVDGRPGIVALHQGQTAPSMLMPIPDPTFFPNRFDDPTPTSPITNACNNVSNDDASSSCSLREAVLRANATPGTDTISLAAGTYTLTLPRAASPAYDATTGTLNINDSVNLVGAGQNSTIITWGTPASGTIDMVMAVNEDINPITSATASISNLTIQNGVNHGTNGNDGDGGCMEFDTGTNGTATLTLTNVTLQNCSTLQGSGGGIAIFNFIFPAGNGDVTITNSIVQNNSAADSISGASLGGGIWVSDSSRMTMTGSQVLNNQAIGAAGLGGGINILSVGPGTRQTVIHNSTVSGNVASGSGGGIWDSANLLIDQGTIISGNSAGTGNNVNFQDGGGIFLLPTNPDSVTFDKITIIGNTTTGNGGGIAASSGSLTMSFSRVAGNTAAAGSNLSNNGAVVTATNDWWGTNAAATTINTFNSGSTTFDPFIVLTNTANPNTIVANQSSTLTADMSADNHGNNTDLSGNLDVLNGLPVTFNNAVLGTIVETQPEALNAGAQATATYNAGGTNGAGSADATVDQQTVTAPITISTAIPPTISKLFLPDTITVNGTVLLSFTLTNPNSDPNPSVTLTGIQFSDNLPAGVVVASPNQLSNDCGGTVTADPGSSSISLSGGTIGTSVPLIRITPKVPLINAMQKGPVRAQTADIASGSCFISVLVQATTTGIKNNTTGPISANESGPGTTSNTATLTVNAAPTVQPPTAAKSFGAAAIPLSGTTSLTFAFTNPNANTNLLNISLSDALPIGMVVSTPNGLGGNCAATISANPGSNTISMISLNLIANDSCSFSVNVTGTSAGVKLNTTSPVTAVFDDGSILFPTVTGGTASASIVVVAPPLIAKSFNPALIAANGTSTLSFTITNPAINLVFETGVAFTDTMPANLVVATPNGTSNTCGGTVAAAAGSNSISLTGGTVAAGGSCTVSVNVTGAVPGVYTNTSGAVSSTNGGTGNTASANLTVKHADLDIRKTHNGDFYRGEIGATYTITVHNDPNVGPTLGTVTVTDTLPNVQHTLVATDISGTGWTCTLATLTCTRSDALASGASYPPITLTVNVPRNITANVTNTATVSGGGDPHSHTTEDETHIGPPHNGGH